MVSHFSTQVEKSTDEMSAEWVGERFPVPYWDPVLKRSPRKVESLLRKLFDHGVVSFRSSLKADVGIFFVKKKTGQDQHDRRLSSCQCLSSSAPSYTIEFRLLDGRS